MLLYCYTRAHVTLVLYVSLYYFSAIRDLNCYFSVIRELKNVTSMLYVTTCYFSGMRELITCY